MKRLACLVLLLLIGCATTSSQMPTPLWAPSQLSPDHRMFESVVLLSRPFSQGTGIVVRITPDDVYILTASHVVHPNFMPCFADGVPIRMVATSSTHDLALLAVPNVGTYAKVHTFASADFDETAWAVGFSVYGHGPIALIHRGFVVTPNFGGFVAFNGGGRPGMSGGPLLNCCGQVLGIMSFVSTAWNGPNFSQICFVSGPDAETFVTETLNADK